MKTETDTKSDVNPAPQKKVIAKMSSLRANVARETDGDWVKHPDLEGAAVKVRSFNYPPYKVARDLFHRRLAKKYKGEPSIERDNELDIGAGKLYAEHILLDWRGFDVAYSFDEAHDRLSDLAWRPLREFVEFAAGSLAAIDAEFVEVAAKNSGPASAIA